MFDKIKKLLQSLWKTLMKESFLLFIYAVISLGAALVLWLLFKYVLPNASIYTSLLTELNNMPILVYAFLVVVCFGSIYLYRFLYSAVQNFISK